MLTAWSALPFVQRTQLRDPVFGPQFDDDRVIRQHLAMIAVKFAQGDFDIPMFIHATVPPGVETMKRLKDKIAYQVENTTHGAQLRITTDDAGGLAAIHDFLRFQIQEHQTGDSLEEQK